MAAGFNKADKYWLWLSSLTELGIGSKKRLLKVFGNPEEIYRSDIRLLKASGVLDEKKLNDLLNFRKSFNIEKNIEYLVKKGIGFITIESNAYPERLKCISDKPLCLYVKGKFPDNVKNAAVVGARGCSEYGRQMALRIGRELAEMGAGVISGLARGTDTFGHLGALKGNGYTCAVLGCGVDICYPPENIETYERIIEKGGIISEFPPGSQPKPWHFPMRNRIISGLSDIVIVVEAREKSGSLITADNALSQGKDVMAVPGRADDPLSAGCNGLIRDGAYVYTNAKDITDILGLKTEKLKKTEDLTKGLEKDYEILYSLIEFLPVTLNELTIKTGFNTDKIYDMLLKLQMDGLIYEPVKNHYAKRA